MTQLKHPVRELEGIMQKAQHIAEGTITEKSFLFDGIEYDKKSLNDGYSKVTQEREKLFNESFKDWDKEFFGAHYQKAKIQNIEDRLFKIYQQHKALIRFYKFLVVTKNKIYEELARIQQQEGVTQSQVNDFGDRVNGKVDGLNVELSKLLENDFTSLPNVHSKEELANAIITDGKFLNERGPMFENGGFDRILNQIENAVMHCQRLDQKSIASILEFHKSLGY